MGEEVFVSEPGNIEIDAHGVVTSYRSGNREYRARMSRASFRRFVERSLIKLADWETANRGRVIEFPPGGH